MSEPHAEDRRMPWWVFCGIVVLLIVAVDISGPILAMLTQRTRSDLNKEMMRDVQVALGYYRTEYNTWPDDPALANANSVPIKLRGPVLNALLGNNPRALKCLNLSELKHRRGPGLVMVQGAPEVHAPWGTCFFLMADIKHENRITNPELIAGAVPGPEAKPPMQYLPTSSALFSAGPDRDPTTWADNITSWR